MTEGTPPPTVVDSPPAADLPDGKWFGFVTVNGDNGLTVVTIDMDDEIAVITLADGAEIKVLSAITPEKYLTIDATTLESLFNGSYAGEPVYGIIPEVAAPMDITVEEGVITVIESVYLP